MGNEKKYIAENRKARFNYSVEETYECGLELQGTEVKSVKNGNISFPDSFAEISNGEVWLKNFHISEYFFSSIFNHLYSLLVYMSSKILPSPAKTETTVW